MQFDLNRVREISRRRPEDLLDRATVYREDGGAGTITVNGNWNSGHSWKRSRRTTGSGESATRRERTVDVQLLRPAGGLRGWVAPPVGKIPLFPRRFRYCEVHKPEREHGDTKEI